MPLYVFLCLLLRGLLRKAIFHHFDKAIFHHFEFGLSKWFYKEKIQTKCFLIRDFCLLLGGLLWNCFLIKDFKRKKSKPKSFLKFVFFLGGYYYIGKLLGVTRVAADPECKIPPNKKTRGVVWGGGGSLALGRRDEQIVGCLSYEKKTKHRCTQRIHTKCGDLLTGCC